MGRPTFCKYCKNEFIRLDKDDTHIIDKVICPICNIPYCNKDSTEKDLFLLQEKYIRKELPVNSFIDKIYNTIYNYTRSMILSNFRNRLHDSNDLENYTIQSIHYFFIYFLKDPDFFVSTSFSGLIYHKIVQSLNEKSNRDFADYSMDYKFEDGNEVVYRDNKKTDTEEIEDYDNRFDLLKHILNLIFSLENNCNNKRENFVRLQAVYQYLTFGEKRADILFRHYGRFSKLKYEETLECLHKELKKLYKGSN